MQLAEIAERMQIKPTFDYVDRDKNIVVTFGELDDGERLEYCDIDERGKRLIFPDQGGSYENLTRRPLDPVVVQYSGLAVSYLVRVYETLEKKLTERWKQLVIEESLKRVEECLLPKFGGRGKFRALAPPHWS